MNVVTFEHETLETCLEQALAELNVKEDEILYISEEVKGGLFKKTSIKLSVVTLSEVSSFIKEYLGKLLKDMDIEATMETKIRNRQIQIKMFSDRNQILIGKNGRTLQALQVILKQVVQNQVGMAPHIILNVEDYKEKQQMHLERMVKRVAREVADTKVDVTLDSMNSYERRIVHNILTNYKNIYTISEGEEPNRCVIVKYKGKE